MFIICFFITFYDPILNEPFLFFLPKQTVLLNRVNIFQIRTLISTSISELSILSDVLGGILVIFIFHVPPNTRCSNQYAAFLT